MSILRCNSCCKYLARMLEPRRKSVVWGFVRRDQGSVLSGSLWGLGSITSLPYQPFSPACKTNIKQYLPTSEGCLRLFGLHLEAYRGKLVLKFPPGLGWQFRWCTKRPLPGFSCEVLGNPDLRRYMLSGHVRRCAEPRKVSGIWRWIWPVFLAVRGQKHWWHPQGSAGSSAVVVAHGPSAAGSPSALAWSSLQAQVSACLRNHPLQGEEDPSFGALVLGHMEKWEIPWYGMA